MTVISTLLSVISSLLTVISTRLTVVATFLTVVSTLSTVIFSAKFVRSSDHCVDCVLISVQYFWFLFLFCVDLSSFNAVWDLPTSLSGVLICEIRSLSWSLCWSLSNRVLISVKLCVSICPHPTFAVLDLPTSLSGVESILRVRRLYCWRTFLNFCQIVGKSGHCNFALLRFWLHIIWCVDAFSGNLGVLFPRWDAAPLTASSWEGLVKWLT